MLDQLLEKFTSTDSLRPALTQPNKIGEMVYATDAHAIIAIPIHLLSGEYSMHEECPSNMDKIVLTAIEQGRNMDGVVIDHEKLLALLNEVPTEPFYDDCKKCEGEGTIECEHCGNTYDCKKCNGSGSGTKIQGYSFVYHTFIEIYEVLYHPQLIEKLVTVQGMVQMPVVLKIKNDNAMNSFLIGDVFVGLMPRSKPFSRHDKCIYKYIH